MGIEKYPELCAFACILHRPVSVFICCAVLIGCQSIFHEIRFCFVLWGRLFCSASVACLDTSRNSVCHIALYLPGNVSRHCFPFTNKVGQLYMIHKMHEHGYISHIVASMAAHEEIVFPSSVLRHAKQLAYESIEIYNIQRFKWRTKMKDQPIGTEDKLEHQRSAPSIFVLAVWMRLRSQ